MYILLFGRVKGSADFSLSSLFWYHHRRHLITALNYVYTFRILPSRCSACNFVYTTHTYIYVCV